MNKLSQERFYKCLDSAINKLMEQTTNNLVNFIERCYTICVRKLTCKYIFNSQRQMILIGCSEILFDLIEKAGSKADTLRSYILADDGRCSIDLLQRYQSTLRHPKEVDTFHYNDPNILQAEEGQEAVTAIRKRPMSSKLLSKMLLSQCQGDFCEFYVASADKASYDVPLHLKNQITVVKKEGVQEYLHNPCKIPRILKVKCRDRMKETIQTLRKNLIFPLSLKNVERVENDELEHVMHNVIKKQVRSQEGVLKHRQPLPEPLSM